MGYKEMFERMMIMENHPTDYETGFHQLVQPKKTLPMTNDELRQLLIVRQSQMERSINYYTLMGVQPSVMEVLTTAEVFKDFVYQGLSPEVKDRARKMSLHMETLKTLLETK